MKSLPQLILFAALAPVSYSQSVLYTFNGDLPDDSFGRSVSAAGDVNGDGYADLIVGAPEADSNGVRSGMARVFSGLDGSVLHTFAGDSPGDLLGFSVSGAGDVDGDGRDDLIVGAPGVVSFNGDFTGSALVFSGFDGSIIHAFTGQWSSGWFGHSVSGVGEADRMCRQT